MQEYKEKKSLIEEIEKRADLFINEFEEIPESKKDLKFEEVDRTPYQILAYNIGWMELILFWEEQNKKSIDVKTPHEDYKWNNLGGLYESFYKKYENLSLKELEERFKKDVRQITDFVDSCTDEEIFEQNKRQWASSTKSCWPVYKWIHINTVAPFKTFRTKIRKWKKLAK